MQTGSYLMIILFIILGTFFLFFALMAAIVAASLAFFPVAAAIIFGFLGFVFLANAERRSESRRKTLINTWVDLGKFRQQKKPREN